MAEDRVTWVGLRGIVTDVTTVTGYNTTGGTTTSYVLRSSVGSHAFPLSQEQGESADCLAALDDTDWATRLAAIEALMSADAPLDDEAFTGLRHVAWSDPVTIVRLRA